MENSTALAKRQQENLSVFGDRAEVREMFQRIKQMIPGAAQAPDTIVLAAAQKAIAHNLDLFDDEIYIMEIKGRWMAHVGVNGLRRNAEGKYYFEESDEYPRQLSEQEVKADMGNLYKRGAIGVEVRMYNLLKAREAKEIGIPYFPRKERGYWKPDDQVPATRTPVWVAQKRAEKMALRSEFSLKFREESTEETIERIQWKLEQHDRDTSIPHRAELERMEDGTILYDAPAKPQEPEGEVKFYGPAEAEPEIEEGEYRTEDDPPPSVPEQTERRYAPLVEELTDNCLTFARFCRQHRDTGGPCSDKQYRYLVGVINNEIAKQPDAHSAVLEVMLGRAVSSERVPGYELTKRLLDWLPEFKSEKQPDGEKIKVENPTYRADIVQYVRTIWNVIQEANGQLKLELETA